MQYGLGCLQARVLRAGLLTTGLAMTVLGCHGKRQAPVTEQTHITGAKTPAELADKAASVIAAVCTRQSYETASVGLIAGETGLREDVFGLRDPASYKVVPYRLRATVRLEELLREGAEAAGRPSEQAECMRMFADHLKGLTDPLVETAKDEKEVDALAFKDADQDAQQEVEMEEQEMKKLK